MTFGRYNSKYRNSQFLLHLTTRDVFPVHKLLSWKVYLIKVHWSRDTRQQVGEGWDSPRPQQLFPYHLTAC